MLLVGFRMASRRNLNLEHITMNWKISDRQKRIVTDGALAIFYIITIYLYTTHYTWPKTIMNGDNIPLSVWNEIANVTTVAPVVFFGLMNVKLKNVGTKKEKIVRLVESTFGTVLFWFYRVAVALELSSAVFAIVGFAQYLVLLIIKIISYSGEQDYIVTNNGGIISRAIETISNRNILSIQLFHVNHKLEGGMDKFTFRCIDHMENASRNVDCDVNCMMVTTLELPHEEYKAFLLAQTAYNMVMDSGLKTDEDDFLSIVKKEKLQLMQKLKSLSLQDIEKVNCCEARLVLCYSNLERMVNTPAYSITELENGTLGINEEIDKKLFTMARTGILGAVLFGENLRYSFKYNKQGIKTGRQYSASVLGVAGEESNSKLVCLTTIAERDGKSSVSDSLFQYVRRCENKITNTIRREKIANA